MFIMPLVHVLSALVSFITISQLCSGHPLVNLSR